MLTGRDLRSFSPNRSSHQDTIPSQRNPIPRTCNNVGFKSESYWEPLKTQWETVGPTFKENKDDTCSQNTGCVGWSISSNKFAQTIKKAEHRRIDAFEWWCWRGLLSIPWTERRSNQFTLKEISPEYSLEGLMLKLEHQTLATWCEKLTHLKRPWC